MIFCANCGDEFEPVEYRPASIDDDNFCSELCEQEKAEEDAEVEELSAIYDEARYGSSVVHE